MIRARLISVPRPRALVGGGGLQQAHGGPAVDHGNHQQRAIAEIEHQLHLGGIGVGIADQDLHRLLVVDRRRRQRISESWKLSSPGCSPLSASVSIVSVSGYQRERQILSACSSVAIIPSTP